MKFLCGSCRTKYQIADEKVRGKILTIRCKKCGAKVLVKESLSKDGQIAIAPLADEVAAQKKKRETEAKKSASSGALASAFDAAMDTDSDESPTRVSSQVGPIEGDDGIEWFTAIDGVQHGPYSFSDLLRQIRAEELIGRHYVWHDGFGPWKRVRECGELNEFLKDSVAKSMPPPPPPKSESPPEEEIVPLIKPKQADPEKSLDDVADETESKPDSLEHEPFQEEESNAATERSVEPIELGSRSGAGEALRADMFTQQSETGDIDPDALFRGVPSSEDAVAGPKESTKFFVAAAGVNAKKSRGKFGVALGLAVLGLVGAGFYGLSSGKISIGARVDDPLAGMTKTTEKKAPTVTRELTPEEKAALRRELTQKKRKPTIQELARMGKKTKPKLASTNREGASNGEAENEPRRANGNQARTGDESSLSIEFPKGSTEFSKPKIKPLVPDTDLSVMEVPSTGRLDQSMIRQVVNQRKSSMGICYQRELKGNSNLGGKVEFVVTVQPNGIVSKSVVRTAKFKGSGLAECFADKIMSWRFPEFSGQPQQIIVPFVLQQRNTY